MFLCNFITWNDTGNSAELLLARALNVGVTLGTDINHSVIVGRAMQSICVNIDQGTRIYHLKQRRKRTQDRTRMNINGAVCSVKNHARYVGQVIHRNTMRTIQNHWK